MIEEWKDIEGYEGLYEVSNLGNVRSLGNGKSNKSKEILLKSRKNKYGYLQIGLCKDGKQKTYRIHRLVAQAFIPNPENKKEIDHINTVRDDNRVENLRWSTRVENINNNLSKIKYSDCRFSFKNHKAKSILQFNNNMELVKKWDCTMDIERELGFKHQNISSVCLGKREISFGFKWGYESDYEPINFKVFDLKIYKKRSA